MKNYLRKKDKLADAPGMSYKGEESYIIMKREYFIDWTCEYDLLYYPFDTQVKKLTLTGYCHWVSFAENNVVSYSDSNVFRYQLKHHWNIHRDVDADRRSNRGKYFLRNNYLFNGK